MYRPECLSVLSMCFRKFSCEITGYNPCKVLRGSTYLIVGRIRAVGAPVRRASRVEIHVTLQMMLSRRRKTTFGTLETRRRRRPVSAPVT